MKLYNKSLSILLLSLASITNVFAISTAEVCPTAYPASGWINTYQNIPLAPMTKNFIRAQWTAVGMYCVYQANPSDNPFPYAILINPLSFTLISDNWVKDARFGIFCADSLYACQFAPK